MANLEQLEPPELLLSDSTIRFLGEATLLEARATTPPDQPRRTHLLQHWEVDGFQHTVWHTLPVPEREAGLTLITKPGFGEIIEDGIGWEFHRELSHQLPGAEIISHASHGVGPHSERIPAWQLPSYGLDRMATQGLELALQIRPDTKKVLVGTSMGTVILNRLINLNLELGQPLQIDGVVYYAPAIVDPSNVVRDMDVRFIPELAIDIVNELVLRTSPKHWRERIKTLRASKMSWSDIPPMGRQILDLIHGTTEDDVRSVLATGVPIEVIVGTNDSVGQIKMWHRLAEDYPNLLVDPVPKRGHGMTLDANRGAIKIAKGLRHNSGLYSEAV